MIGAGEAFFAAFALSKGLGEVVAGLIIGLPLMMGASLQALTPPLFVRFARPRRWVLMTATFQIITLAALAGTSVLEQAGPVTIFLLIGLYWGFSFSASTVWNYWMGFLVPESERSAFFAKRLRIGQIGIVAGLLIGGSLLHEGEIREWGTGRFFLPFLVAFLARGAGVLLMSGQAAIPYEKVRQKFTLDLRVFLKETLGVFRENPQARKDLTFLFLFNTAIFISSSFVTPFLLAKLQFSYLSFMASQIALYFGKIAALFWAQKWVDRHGVRRIMFWGALGMSPLPALWLVIEHTIDAVLLQAASGFFWGLFEVALSLVLFSELPHRDKIQLLTWNNFFVTSAILIGTLVGGKILSLHGESVQGYFVIFASGALARTLLVLAHRPKAEMNSR